MSFQHWQTSSSCALSQPNRKQEDQKTSLLKVKKNGSKTFQINSILHMSPQVEKVIIMLVKLIIKASISINDILCGLLNDLLDIVNGSSLIKNESSFGFSFVKKKKLHSCKNTLKAIGNMYTTKAIHSRLAFAKYAKMSVSLQKLRIQKSRAVTFFFFSVRVFFYGH